MPYTTASTPARSVTCGARMNVRIPANRGITCASSGRYGGSVTARAYSFGVLWSGAPYEYSRGASGLVFAAGACPLDEDGVVVEPGDLEAQAERAARNLLAAFAEADVAPEIGRASCRERV